jgi:hypothetical protein
MFDGGICQQGGGCPTQEGQEITMESPGLTREQIALSILNGMLGTLGKADESAGILEFLDGPVGLTQSLHRRLCVLAFRLADSFIQERDGQP